MLGDKDDEDYESDRSEDDEQPNELSHTQSGYNRGLVENGHPILVRSVCRRYVSDPRLGVGRIVPVPDWRGRTDRR